MTAMMAKYANSIRLSAIVVALTTLYPPWNFFEKGQLVETAGYAFLLTPPVTDSGVAQINITTLAVEIVVALTLIWGFTLGSSGISKVSDDSSTPEEKETRYWRTIASNIINDKRYFSIVIFGLVGIAGIALANKFFQPSPSSNIVKSVSVPEIKPLKTESPATTSIQSNSDDVEKTKRMLSEMHQKHIQELAKQQQIERQNDLRRARLFRPKVWSSLKIPMDGVKAQLQTVLDAHAGVYYKFWLEGSPEQLEMAKSYYSGFNVQMLDRQGFKISEFIAYEADLVSNQSKGARMILSTKGNLPLLEEEYSKITHWAVSPAAR